MLQRDEPHIHLLLELLTNLYCKFVTADATIKAKDIFSVEYDVCSNQKSRDTLVTDQSVYERDEVGRDNEFR